MLSKSYYLPNTIKIMSARDHVLGIFILLYYLGHFFMVIFHLSYLLCEHYFSKYMLSTYTETNVVCKMDHSFYTTHGQKSMKNKNRRNCNTF